jgi:hypothetical protein
MVAELRWEGRSRENAWVCGKSEKVWVFASTPDASFFECRGWKKSAGIGNLIDESGNAVSAKFKGLLFWWECEENFVFQTSELYLRISCLWRVEDIIDQWKVQISKVELSVQGLKRFFFGKAIRFLLVGKGETVHWVL